MCTARSSVPSWNEFQPCSTCNLKGYLRKTNQNPTILGGWLRCHTWATIQTQVWAVVGMPRAYAEVSFVQEQNQNYWSSKKKCTCIKFLALRRQPKSKTWGSENLCPSEHQGVVLLYSSGTAAVPCHGLSCGYTRWQSSNGEKQNNNDRRKQRLAFFREKKNKQQNQTHAHSQVKSCTLKTCFIVKLHCNWYHSSL